ncbi:hypothetical protein G9C98_000563 [Cotesia typhae]|uniref:J domain-containing protein n=1 Tax=Cotesia typhae TaxID=2053667 RepID=A0A8J5RH84_9HYME|nr:hypothetical protein G9C98_000563 [Cotesia typhae]
MVCFNCGLRWHKMHQCPAEGKVCLKCGEKNHFARICRTSGEKTPLASEAMKKDTAANNHQELCPTSELNYGNRAACYIMMERYEDGLADAKRSVELNSTFVRGHERAIRCLIELGNITEAGTWVKKLESVDPKNERLSVEKEKINNTTRYLNKIDKLSSEKKYAEAVKYLDKLIAVSSQYVSYKMRKAEFWVLLEKYKEAEPLINDILKRNQSNLDVVYLLGRCLYYLDTERAIPQLKEVFRLVPDHSDGLKLYKNAKALIDKKNEGNNAFIHRKYSKAHKIYSEALQIDPSNQRMMMKLYYNLAQASYKLDEISKSIEECTKALAIDPNFYKALLRRGQNYVETCDYEEAVADFTKAVNIESSSEARKLLDEAKKLLAKAKNDYHGILGVKKNASMDDIKKAYHEKAKLHHPDRHSSGSLEEKVNNEKKFKEITRAYRSLTNGSNPKKYKPDSDVDDNDDEEPWECPFDENLMKFMFSDMNKRRFRFY